MTETTHKTTFNPRQLPGWLARYLEVPAVMAGDWHEARNALLDAIKSAGLLEAACRCIAHCDEFGEWYGNGWPTPRLVLLFRTSIAHNQFQGAAELAREMCLHGFDVELPQFIGIEGHADTLAMVFHPPR